MSASDHTAVGQALGYVYQFDRATYRLLQADNSVVSVSVEHVDDVSLQRVDGTAVHEQDKVTVTGRRPLTDLSVALWKTLATWADQVESDPAILLVTEFHLVTNSQVAPGSLAARLHAASEHETAVALADELLATSVSLRADLEKFGVPIRSLGRAALADLILRIAVVDNAAMQYGGDLDQLLSLRFFSALQREAVFNHASAWVRRQILAAAQNGTPTTIDRAEFGREVRALLRHISVAPLAVMFDMPATATDPAQYRSYGFFQQLDWIDSDPLFVRECAIHFAQARYMRARWAETDAVPEAALRAYEEDLRFRWTLLSSQQASRSYPTPITQGQELLNQTLSQDTALQGQQLPKAFTCGSFHALADFDARREPSIGWHPDFKERAGAKGDS